MDVSYILEFTSLADNRSFSATAYQLHISQATLSRHIQSLERELGHLLFIRSTRNVELSDYGRIYLPYAKQISECVRQAEAARLSYEKQCADRTLVGIARHPDLFLAAELIAGFRRSYPDIPLQVFEGSLSELRQRFQSSRLRIVSMTYATWETLPQRFIPAGKSRLVAILPETHPLAEYEKIPVRQLDDISLMVPEQTSYPYQYLLHIFKQEDIHPNIVYQGSSTGIEHLLKEGMGIFIQDKAIAEAHSSDSLVIRELEPDISYVFGLEYQSNLTKNEQLYVRYIEKELAKNNCFQRPISIQEAHQ